MGWLKFKRALHFAVRVVFFGIFLLGILWLVEAYATYRQLTEQLPTFANLQCSAIEVQKMQRLDMNLERTNVEKAIVDCFGSAQDVWGNEIQFLISPENPHSFLLISLGSDGKLDIPDPHFYFNDKPRNIIGQLERDIIFRDGVAVTDAGKK